MAYRLPVWAFTAAIWHDGTPTADPPDELCSGNLAMGRRTSKVDDAYVPFDPTFLPSLDLLVPKGTDIRGDVDTNGSPDTVEIPVGSGSFWNVHWVHPVGLGFPNEHVRAVVTPIPTAPPPPGDGITTELSEPITTELGDVLITE